MRRYKLVRTATRYKARNTKGEAIAFVSQDSPNIFVLIMKSLVDGKKKYSRAIYQNGAKRIFAICCEP